MVEVLRQPGKIRVDQVDGAGLHAGFLEFPAYLFVAEAGDAPHLVLPGQLHTERRSNPARGPGDEDLSVPK